MTARILVVDDVELNVRLLEAKLSNEYFEVIAADNGPQALELAESELPDIILFARVRSLVRLKRMMEEFRLREEVCGRFSSGNGTEAAEDTSPAKILLLKEPGFAATRIVETLTPVAKAVLHATSCAEAQR